VGAYYVANYAYNTVSVIDMATNMVTVAIPVGTNPLAFGTFIQPAPRFAGTPGKANYYGKSVSVLARKYGGLNDAAAALDYASVGALQEAIPGLLRRVAVQRTGGRGARDLICTRTAEGRSRAQKRGQHMGRPSKLTDAQKAEARRRRAQGATLAELARSYDVGKSTISRL
jgi:YVTN family beta-propeller protein